MKRFLLVACGYLIGIFLMGVGFAAISAVSDGGIPLVVIGAIFEIGGFFTIIETITTQVKTHEYNTSLFEAKQNNNIRTPKL